MTDQPVIPSKDQGFSVGLMRAWVGGQYALSADQVTQLVKDAADEIERLRAAINVVLAEDPGTAHHEQAAQWEWARKYLTDALRGAPETRASPRAQDLFGALSDFLSQWKNRGETTSLHEWHTRMKESAMRAEAVLNAKPPWDCECNEPECAYCGPRLAQKAGEHS